MKTIEEYLIDISGIFSFINLLKMSSNISDFREWVKNNYTIGDQELFIGYKFLIDVINNRIIDEINTSSWLNLETDLICERAEFHGVNINDIPNSCEKIIFLKNFWNILKKTRDSDDWDSLEIILKSINQNLAPFNHILKNYASTTNKKESKREILRKASIINIHIHLHDTRRGCPLLYPAPMLDSLNFKDDREDFFTGYVYGLEYIWFKLLGKKRFENSIVKNLHRSNELFSGKESDYSSKISNDFFFDKESKCITDWQCFDNFFPIINKEIVEPLTISPKRKSGILIITNDYNKTIFKELLKKIDLSEPIYLSNPKTQNDQLKRISFYFYWYETDYLDADILPTNGYPAFSAALIGELSKYEINKVKDSVQVIRIKHQVDKNKYDYSYSILFSSSPSLISDYSGWLTFCRVGTDYSGFGGYQHKITEDLIKKYQNEGKIFVREFDVDLDSFKSYLGEKNESIFRGEEIKIFISYASEDKQIARQIAKDLHKRGINVWFDEFSLELGDSTRISIEKGINESDYAILLLSKSYFLKKWPQRELTAILVNEEMKDTKLKKLLPIWHNISKEEVARNSPLLADLHAIKTSAGIDIVIRKIMGVIEPFNGISFEIQCRE